MPTDPLKRPARRGGVPLVLALLGLVLSASGGAWGKAIPRDAYLQYIPLEHPPLVRQTAASAAFALFGDPEAPGFVDVDPRDGIDDRRGHRLHELASRFGPIMVANTSNLPMDFRRFMTDSRTFKLHVDTWSLVGPGQNLAASAEVDVAGIAETPCESLPSGSRDAAGDCLLQDLLRRYDPNDPDYADLTPRAVDPVAQKFEVMFFDFPGEGPESWKREFENTISGLLPSRYQEYLKVYMHPFVHTVPGATGGEDGYELVLQYYFFYPTNDGGNNHEGDWEHINVSIAPRATRNRPLRADEVRAILAGEGDDNELVIRHVDYYFHYQVYRMDYTRPDAYAPREEWEHQLDAKVAELHGQRRTWRAIRDRAWWDADEKIVNTHPICFIGADNKGLDQVLSPPGGTNRDSHGTYPYTGMYKDIGPGGATEQINAYFDHRKWYRKQAGDITGRDQKRFGRGEAVPYTTRRRIEVLPDWEHILAPVRDDPVARRDWFWMLLPVRWGYPATESPFAGVVAHAETGNLAPYGPMFQPHWNRPGSEGGANPYEPHSFETLFPLGFQDTFVNSWGYLNLTLPVIAAIPPLDFAWRLAAYPFRRLLSRNDPVFFPTDRIPSRFVGVTVGASGAHYNEEVAGLVLNGESGLEQLLFLSLAEPDGVLTVRPEVAEPKAWWWQINFYLGDRFVTQNTLLHARSDLKIHSTGASGASHVNGAELNLWEYAGSFRYDLSGSALRPYLKLGYGWTWYRTEKAYFDDIPLPTSQGDWISQPSFKTLSDMLPSSWHGGVGLEIIGYRSGVPFPGGVDFSLVSEVTYTSSTLGLDDWLLVGGAAPGSGSGLIDTIGFKRWTWNLGLTLGF
jgi:hypothetical protein